MGETELHESQPRRVEQVPGGMGAIQGERHVAADDVAPAYQLVDVHEASLAPFGAGRITQQGPHAQRLKHGRQSAADLPYPDNAHYPILPAAG